MDPESTRELLRWLARTEAAQVVAMVLLGLLLAAACWLLLENNARLDELHAQLLERNRQGAQVLTLLDETLQRLNAR
jgi:hypothetical protein